MGSVRFEIDNWSETQRLKAIGGISVHEGWRTAEHALHSQGNIGLWSVNAALFYYLSMPLDNILTSDIALIRGIGMPDRRLGKRRFVGIDRSGAPSLVRNLHLFRCRCEGIAQV